MGKTSIMFFDIENMGMGAKLFVLVLVLAAFGALAKFFHGELWNQEISV